jgi:hypothetical protein
VAAALAVGIFAAVAFFRGREVNGTGSALRSPGGEVGATVVGAGAGFGALKGRWVRPDGGYILHIRDVDAGGKIGAMYLNPRPINVARAEARRDGSRLQVFVELRDVNYPGSTYTLQYDPASDRLKGSYFQAVEKQTYAIEFIRAK